MTATTEDHNKTIEQVHKRTDAVIAKYDYILQYVDLLKYCQDMTENSKELERELDEMIAYADKLAQGFPEGMLPKDVEVLREANHALAEEVYRLRHIFPKILEALGNGSGCVPDVSIEFLEGIPREVELVVRDLKR
jgi:hypothetical protein